MRRRFAGRLAVVVFSFLALALAPALAQEALKIADEVSETVETPHPYPAGGPGLVPVWTHTFHWPEASYIAVHFETFELAPGDLLVLRDPEGRYRHTYTGRGLQERGGDFWGLSILGDTMELLLFSKQREHDAHGLVIDRWAHGYPTRSRGAEPDALCGSEDFRDIECYPDTYPAEYGKARAAVRLIKNGSAHCTGWLASCENHIITNEHCVGSQSELDTIEFQFEYKRPDCGSGTASVELQIQGGTLLRNNAGLDYALIMPELAGNDPQGNYGFMQIDTRIPDIGELMYIPGHPSGDPKRLSIESTHPNDPTGRCEVFSVTEPACTGGPVPDVGYYCDTEGGSSGSAVLSSETNKVIALHHCANCPNRGVPILDVFNDIQASATPLPACSTCQPPAVPLDLVASSPGDNRIFLDWVASPGAVLYRVYRSTQGCESGFEEIGTSTEPSFLDESVAGGITYFYKVSSEADCGGESSQSNCAEATPSGICTEPPRFSGLASATSSNESSCATDLSWEEATARCGSVRYNVYRSTVPGFEPGPANIVASCLTTTSWRDTDVLSRVPYYYVVRAEDDAEQGGGPCSGGNEEQNLVARQQAARGPDEVLFEESFDGRPGAWQLGPEWQITVPRGEGGSADGGLGGPDPFGTPAGATGALGLDLSGTGSSMGNYENNMAESASLSPPANLGGSEEVRLRFWRHLSVNAGPGDRARLEVCLGASDCTEIWGNPQADFRDSEWTLVDYDVSEHVAGAGDARVRFSHSSDGSGVAAGWTVDEVAFYQPTSCASEAIDLPPVPDGRFAPGTPAYASAGAAGQVSLSWDVTKCVSPEYHLFYGSEADLATYGYEASACDIGSSGNAIVAIPDPEPGHLTWWTIVGASGSAESVHGYDSRGALRPANAGSLCGITEQSTAGVCP